MRWLNVFHLQSLIAVLGCLLLFTQCRTVPEDTVLPVPILSRGDLLGDPIVESVPESVSLIKVNNSYDDVLISSQYAGVSRPTNITNYGRFKVVEIIRPDDLLNHEFNWVSTQRKNVMVAIFKNVVRVESNQISNKSDLIWMWTPSDSKLDVDPGRINYAEGKAVALDQNNQFTYSPPVNLTINTYYVWCVLAWDNQGLRIEYASRELPFRLENPVIPPTLFRGLLNGDPVIQSTSGSVTLIDVNNKYDDLLASDKYKGTPRPTKDSQDYGQSEVVEFISLNDLPKYEFKWVSTQRKNVTVAIFKNIVRVGLDDISNRIDIVWEWKLPSGRADVGRVPYAEVRPLFPLTPKTSYVWCVVARDDQNHIVSASRELPFQVR